MLKKINANTKTVYCLITVVGVFFVVFLAFFFKDAGTLPSTPIQSHTPPAIASNDRNQSNNVIERIISVPSDTGNTAPETCSIRCQSTLAMLDQDLNLDDDAFGELSANANELAVYLRNNEPKRKHYLQVAMTTADDDKRRFLTDIFKLLPQSQKTELGENLITAEGWRARADGLELIVADGITGLTMANKLISFISNEESSYVKNSILAHLKQSDILKGDTEFLYQLDSVINNDSDASTRVAALKTKMQLSVQAFYILPDAIQALHANEPELQAAGLTIISQILTNEDEHAKNGAYIDKQSIKNDIQNIRNLSAHEGNKEQLAFLIRKADDVYLRHFEQ